MIPMESLVDHFDIVHEAYKEIRGERLDLIEVEGAEQPVMPSERGMGVHHDVAMLLDGASRRDDVLEGGASERVEPADRQIQNSPGTDVGRFGVHHVADMERLDGLSPFSRQTHRVLEVGFFVHADLAGDDGTHFGNSGGVQE